jgi:hypothetical protein
VNAASTNIKKICHELLDRLLDAKVAFHADCIKLGKYDHDSANLNMVIDIDATLDAAKAAYAASVNGGDVRKTLESHRDMTSRGVGTRGLPRAGREIEVLTTKICKNDYHWRKAKAKAVASGVDRRGKPVGVNGPFGVDCPRCKTLRGHACYSVGPDDYARGAPLLRCHAERYAAARSHVHP